MATEGQFRHEDVSKVPRGWRVRTVTEPSGHRVRLAFPPGPRTKGAGKLVSILHPTRDNPCGMRKNSHEVVKDSEGNTWLVDVTHSGKDYLAQGFKRVGKRIPRVGQTAEARGATEAQAYDHLLEKIETNPRRKTNPFIVWKDSRMGGAYNFARAELDSDAGEATLADGTKVQVGKPANVYTFQSLRAAARFARHMNRFPNPRRKQKTREQVEKLQAKAVRFLTDVVGDKAKADEIAALTVEQYAAKKKIKLVNPVRSQKKKAKQNPNGNDPASAGAGSEAAAAAKMYELFHGKKPQEIVTVQKEMLGRKEVAAIGNLIRLKTNLVRLDWSPSDNVILSASPNGQQLYVLGGDQNLDSFLKDSGIGNGKDFVDLGEVKDMVYRTRKAFDQFQESDYIHEMGERGGEPPYLMYDRLNHQLYIVGGSYKSTRRGIEH